MPAWGQTTGGPFTDEQLRQIVAFLRSWEPTAPQIALEINEPDPVRGATIFSTTCFICHGENGMGNERGPRLNDPNGWMISMSRGIAAPLYGRRLRHAYLGDSAISRRLTTWWRC
jgi:mono/diheme cytochrome c family protein